MYNRLGIFAFYDKDGIVDSYIEYLLEETVKILSRLIIVCNGYISTESINKLSNFSNEIYIRENDSYDGGAYKYVLMECIGREEVAKYEELLFFNSTFFGPFYPWEHVFEEMNYRDCDWWGLSKHEEAVIDDKKIASHIQSYFMVLNNNVICSDEFWGFWKKLNRMETFDDAVDLFEIGLSICLTKAGFKSDAFLSIDRFLSDDDAANFNYGQLYCGDAITAYNFPIIKIKCFYYQKPYSMQVHKAVEYIYENTQYPIDYIWQNIYRVGELDCIKKSFGLHHMFYKFKEDNEELKIKFLAIFIVNNFDYLNDIYNAIKYIKSISLKVVVLIENCIDYKYDVLNVDVLYVHKTSIQCWINNNIEMMRCYSYCGIFQEPKEIRCFDRVERAIWHDYCYKDNLFNKKTFNYLEEVYLNQATLKIFYTSNNALEVLMNKKGLWYGEWSDYWREYISPNFWITTDLLLKLLASKSINMENIRWYLSLPKCVKEIGYGINYICWSDNILSSGIQEKYFEERKLLINNIINHIETVTKAIYLMNIDTKIYIYGAGKIAQFNMNVLEKIGVKIDGVIVSDDQDDNQTLFNRRVIRIKDATINEASIIFVCVGEKNLGPVISNLKKNNYKFIVMNQAIY